MSNNGKKNYVIGDVVCPMQTPDAQQQNADTYLGIVTDATNQNALKIDLHCRRTVRPVVLGWSTLNPLLNINDILNHANTRHICCIESDVKLRNASDRIKELEAELEKYKALYNPLNRLLCQIGMEEELHPQSPEYMECIDALYPIDNGVFQPLPPAPEQTDE